MTSAMDWWLVVALVAGAGLSLAIFALCLSNKHDAAWDRGWEAGYKKGWKEAFMFGKEDVKNHMCPTCGELMIKDNSMVYTSLPPKYKYVCPGCGKEVVKID